MKCKWAWLVLIAVYAAAFAANVGHFAWSYPVGAVQILASAVYAAVWIWFVITGRRDRTRLRVSLFTGVLTAVGGVLGLMVRTWGSAGLSLPALAAAGLTVTPLYGLLSLIGDYDLFYLAAAASGAVWTAVSLRLKKSWAKETSETDG